MNDPGKRRPGKGMRPIIVRWLALWPIAFGLAIYPVSYETLRVLTLAVLVLLWAGALWLSWHVQWLRMAGLGLPALLIAFSILPGHETDRVALRESCTASGGH